MAKTLRYRLLHRIRRALRMRRDDDYDWALYDHKYQNEMDEIEREYARILAPGDYVFEDGALRASGQHEKPLHGNARLLYETVLQLAPASACEFGCGGGDHLANLALLAPEISLHGLDRSRGQLALLRRRNPGLRAAVRRHDIARPLPAALPPVDLAYTHAVLMHIHTGDAHLRGLANLFRAARRTVLLIENWLRHPFLDDVRRLEREGRIPWDAVHVHYRHSPELDRPQMMVISAEPLPQWPVLEDYGLMTERCEAMP